MEALKGGLGCGVLAVRLRMWLCRGAKGTFEHQGVSAQGLLILGTEGCRFWKWADAND